MPLTANDVEDVDACVVCGGEESVPVTSVISEAAGAPVFTTSWCARCGSTFRSRRPKLAWHEGASATSFREIWDRRWEATRVHRYRHYLDKFRPHLRPGAAILDIGSNTGVGPRYLEHHGFEVHGIEQELKRVELSQALMRGPVFAGSFEHYPETRQFDAIMLTHVLEHLQTPRALLAKVRRLLADGGIFYVEVPDLHKAVYPGDAFYLGHESNFSRRSLEGLLCECGFAVEEDISRLRINADGTAIGVICKKAEPRPAAWSPGATLDEVRRIYSFRYMRRQPICYRVPDLANVPALMWSLFREVDGQYLPAGRSARAWECFRVGVMARLGTRHYLLKAMAEYANLRHRAFLDEVEATYERLLRAEAAPIAVGRAVAPPHGG